jgi:S-phase kinase-associated protein 1
MLFAILNASHTLGIDNLTQMGCKTVANMISGKTVKQIRTLFSLKNNFTPEDEE